jgi:ring-1,2-phenylacetyl-CoA epoxidase subunit PaaA
MELADMTNANAVAAFTYDPGSVTKDTFFSMPDDYQENCIRIMAMTAYAENLGGEGLSMWVRKAPDNARRRLVARLAYEELDHGYRIYKVLNDLGISENRVNDIANGKTNDKGAIHISLNPAEQMYGGSGEYWLDLALHCVLMDLAGKYIVGNFIDSSYAPWADAAKTIVDEEKLHIGFGRRELERCIDEGVSPDLLQERFTFWYSKALNFFGPPPGKSAELLKKYGIKRKNNDELRDEFKADIEKYFSSIDLLKIIRLNKNTYPFE